VIRLYLLNDDHTLTEVDQLEWAARGNLVEDVERRNVSEDEIAGWRVSTKFIGIDMTPSFFFTRDPDLPPRVFECAVFDPDGDIYVMGRPSSWDEAEAMHQHVCEAMRVLVSADDDGGISHAAINIVRGSLRYGSAR
jgi:hypothetical protein